MLTIDALGMGKGAPNGKEQAGKRQEAFCGPEVVQQST